MKRAGSLVERWLWLCPLIFVALAAAILLIFGLGVWTALLAAALLVCPALIAWAVWRLRGS